jgi:uncharacterized membrane protein YfcA
VYEVVICYDSFMHMLIPVLAAFLAGNLNDISGGGTFLTYPILLAMGYSSIVANATSTVVLWPGVAASLPGYRKEIKRGKKWIAALWIPALLGAIAGSFILTHTSSQAFSLIAPLLIMVGSLIFYYQTGINRFFNKIKLTKAHHRAMFVALFVLAVGVYGAYFGAGIGIVLLGALSILGVHNLYQDIAIKNVLSLIVNFVAVVYFSFSGIVQWEVVPLMAIGAIAGGFSGSILVRRISQKFVRQGIVVLGFTIALILFVARFK